MRPAVWLALAALAACGQRDPTTTVAVYAPTAHATRAGAIAEQRDATRVEERASRSRRSAPTAISDSLIQSLPRPRRATSVRAAPALSSQGGCGPGCGWQTAQASWYGPGFYGHRTACGQTYTPTLVGVAHRTLPCGTTVTLEHNGTVIAAPVIDRGPYVGSRTFDLSQALCRRLGHCFTGPIHYRY